MTTRGEQLEARRTREMRVRGRLREGTARNQACVDAVRAVLGLAPLYGDPYRGELERFHTSRPWHFSDGMRRPSTPTERSALE